MMAASTYHTETYRIGSWRCLTVMMKLIKNQAKTRHTTTISMGQANSAYSRPWVNPDGQAGHGADQGQVPGRDRRHPQLLAEQPGAQQTRDEVKGRREQSRA